jgi:predicted nucleotidyltransferase
MGTSSANKSVPVSSLADALFSTTRQRVLGLLFGQPKRSFYATEIIELANAGRGAVQRELARLERSGLVSTCHIGNQKHYQANPESPLFDELCSIARKTVGLPAQVQAALAPLAGRIQLALIYGSTAKGTDSPTSDVDLLIVADDLALAEVMAATSAVEKQVSRRINPTIYTSREFGDRQATRHPFLAGILEGAYQMVLGRLDDEQKSRKSGRVGPSEEGKA